ncbi:LADA_0H00562g1_1 [Lachancea dasiensis]|uniref:LADA_0H00562g1_1 n=1 Tax=Lachancea dasiensis TaxID=1072105 RepID=A0A1G4JYU0_9SACH|nr:LADA_0H00562g1_1 [Lachancea dasiensis]
MDSERLKVPTQGDSSAEQNNGDNTPVRRGHRHKRSFAISQDLDFVKPIAPGTPHSKADYAASTVSPMRHHQDMSPRFFMSHDITYSDDVPNAIIDLDDALSTRPQSFTSHRRAESAPANLILPFKLEPPAIQTQPPLRIDEEEDGEKSESEDELVSQDALMSPLRTKSQSPFLTSSATMDEQKSPKRNQYNNNTLKISRQKERYLYYTKQLPAASPHGSSHIYPQEPACSSLSSELTPGFSISAITNTPNTPVLSTSKVANKSPSPRRSFNFKSQVYDLPYDGSASNDAYIDARKAQPQNEDTAKVPGTASGHSETPITEAHTIEAFEQSRIPKEILLGQPGDSVDLSQNPKSPSKAPQKKRASTSSEIRATSDQRSVSDSAVMHGRQQTSTGKRKGKFHLMSTLFSRLKNPK